MNRTLYRDSKHDYSIKITIYICNFFSLARSLVKGQCAALSSATTHTMSRTLGWKSGERSVLTQAFLSFAIYVIQRKADSIFNNRGTKP